MIPYRSLRILSVMLAVSLATVALPVTAQIVTNEDGGIVWPEFEQAVARSGESGKILMVDVWSATCGWCRKQQTEVYTRPELQQLLAEHFEIGRIVIDRTTDTLSFRGFELSSAELAAGLGASGTPTTVFLEPSGAYITRLAGFHPYEDFMDVLAFIGTESFRSMEFQDFVALTEREEKAAGSN